MELLQLFDADLGVNGVVSSFSCQATADVADVRPTFEPCASGRCAGANGSFLFGQSAFSPTPSHAAEHVRVERPAVAVEESAWCACPGRGGGASAASMLHPKRPAGDGHHAVFLPLALADVDGAALGVQVGQVEAAKLARRIPVE